MTQLKVSSSLSLPIEYVTKTIGVLARASTIGVALSKLRKLGLVEPSGEPTITEAGLASATFEPLPQGEALLDYWRSVVGKAERAVLDVLVAEYPGTVTHVDLADRTGYSPDASTIGVAMSKLRRLELADGWRASDEFMEAIR